MANDHIMNNSSQFIHCMLIPLQQHYLLLPNSTISEVIPKTRIQHDADLPAESLGFVDWLEHNLPIIDLEAIIFSNNGMNEEYANKLCIIRGINPEADVDYYAIPCTGSPQLITVNSAALHLTHDTLDSPYLYCQIKIGNKIAFIPNLDQLETHIKSLGNS